jgi:DNA-binding MarR family transcriptional regulator
MNNKSSKVGQDLLEYQTDRIQHLIEEMVECCNDRKFYESNKFGLPYAEINCLMFFNGEHYLTVKVLSEKLDVAKSRVTKLVKGLTAKGLINQIDDPRDGRITLISLSTKGRRLSKQIEAFQKEIHRKLLLHMEPAERKNALTYLDSLRSAMEAVKEELV